MINSEKAWTGKVNALMIMEQARNRLCSKDCNAGFAIHSIVFRE